MSIRKLATFLVFAHFFSIDTLVNLYVSIYATTDATDPCFHPYYKMIPEILILHSTLIQCYSKNKSQKLIFESSNVLRVRYVIINMIQIIVKRLCMISNWKCNKVPIYTNNCETQPAPFYLRVILLYFVTVLKH